MLKISIFLPFFHLDKALRQSRKGFFKYFQPVENKSNLNLSGRSIIQPGQSGACIYTVMRL